MRCSAFHRSSKSIRRLLEAIRKTFNSVDQQASVRPVVLGKPGPLRWARTGPTDAARMENSDLAKGVNVPFPGTHGTLEMQEELTQATGLFFPTTTSCLFTYNLPPAPSLPKREKNGLNPASCFEFRYFGWSGGESH